MSMGFIFISIKPLNQYLYISSMFNSLGLAQYKRWSVLSLAQTPSPVYDIKITPSHYLARVTWKLQTSASSYITQIIIYLDGNQHWTISRGTQFDITALKPGTMYTVRIQTQDGSSQTSSAEDRNFKTNKAGEYWTRVKTLSFLFVSLSILYLEANKWNWEI
jgi:hypothetical protein